MNMGYRFDAEIEKTDRWDSAKQEGPALSPREAIQIARKFVVQNVPPPYDMREWGLCGISLRPIQGTHDSWMYFIHFQAVPTGLVSSRPLQDIEIPVRFDGTVPTPTPLLGK